MRPKPIMMSAGLLAGALVAVIPSAAHAASTRHEKVNAGSTAPRANALYVATTGSDSNAGTLAAPLRTIQRAVDLAQPGHTILIRGGTYAPSTNIQLLKNGTASQPITMRNYNGERNNQIINLDSYGNRDPRSNGESADGLAIKEGSGNGNVVRGARLWNNSDDGLDWWMFSSPILVENSLAWGNGFNRWNLPYFAGDGNGFKLGGNGVPAQHTVRNSMAWDNAVGGFIDNNNPGRHTIDHCTAWDNPGTGFQVNRSDSTLTRNLAVANGTNVSLGANSSGSGNSWDIGGSWPLANTDQATITGPRTADGSIPSSTFLHPASGSAVGARF